MDKLDATHIHDLNESDLRGALFDLVNKFLKRYCRKDEIRSLLGAGKSDREYMKEFSTKIPTKIPESKSVNIHRAQIRLAEIKKLLSGNILHKIGDGKYLDLGSNECTITRYIGLGMGFSRSNICAVDVDDFSEDAHRQKINFKKINGEELPFADNTFTFVTALQVLHHMVSLDSMLQEIVRTMKDGGIFLIREQDASSELEKHLFDIEHMLYDVAVNKKMSYDEFISDYYSNFHSRSEWHKILNDHGFKFLRVGNITKLNPTKYYYSVYQLSKK